MIKAISGALSMLLIIVVLRLVLPEVATPLIALIVRIIGLTSNALETALAQSSQ